MRNQVLVKGFSSEEAKILITKCMHDVSKRPMGECRNIINSVSPNGVILLNENSITVEQWQEIATKCTNLISWEYAQQN
jgi:hypothetical protein